MNNSRLAPIKKILASRYFPWLAAMLAMLLVSGSLWTGLQYDDYLLREKTLGSPLFMPGDSWNLFSFTPTFTQKQYGIFPWFTAPDLHINFFRPLPSLTHTLDFKFWAFLPSLMHLQNILLSGGIILVLGQLYRRWMTPSWVAGLATLLFAMDATHGVTVGWIANRSLLEVVFFGALTLWCYDRWRQEYWKPGACLAILMFILAMLSGEAFVAILAYLLAYELFLQPGQLRHRLLQWAPYLGVTIIWQWCYFYFGYGTQGSGFYITPLKEPIHFLGAIVERLPVLLSTQWLWTPLDLWLFLTDNGRLIFSGCTLLLLVMSFAFFYPLIRQVALARFFLAGAVLATLPFCAVFPSDRLLLATGIGSAGLVALWMATFFVKGNHFINSQLACSFAFLLLIIHLLLSPFLLIIRSLTPSYFNHIFVESPFPREAQKNAWRQMVVVQAPSCLSTSDWYIKNSYQKAEMADRQLLCLTSGQAPIKIERMDKNTLTITQEGKFNFSLISDFDRLYFVDNHFAPGQIFYVPGATITIEAVNRHGELTKIRVRWEALLESRQLAWVIWKEGRYMDYVLPVFSG